MGNAEQYGDSLDDFEVQRNAGRVGADPELAKAWEEIPPYTNPVDAWLAMPPPLSTPAEFGDIELVEEE